MARDKRSKGFGTDFRRFFLRGLAAVLPAVLTIAIIIWFFSFIDRYIGTYTNAFAQWTVVQYVRVSRSAGPAGEPVEPTAVVAMEPATRATGPDIPSWLLWFTGPKECWRQVLGYWQDYPALSWIGLLLAFVAIYIFGRFVASLFGRLIWPMIETAFFRVPVVKQIYPYVKQVTDFLFSDQKIKFSRVVAVEYPRKGLWSLGLVTAPGMRTVQKGSEMDLLTVFVPSSPTPVTGYTVMVRRDEVVDLPITIDEALRFTVSGGVIMPATQQLGDAEVARARHGALPAVQPKEHAE